MSRVALVEEHNRLLDAALAYRDSKPLLVALDYDLFSWIDRGRTSASALGRALKLDARAVGIVLDAVSALGFLDKQGGHYANTPLSRKLLVSTSPHYRGANMRYQNRMWEAWSDLKGVLRRGRPRRALVDWIAKNAFTPDYVRAMGDVAWTPARDLASQLDLKGVGRMLDVGCGPGVYSRALVEREPTIEATLLDYPKTIRVARRILKAHPRARRFRFKPADFLGDDLGREAYDLALLSNVTHMESSANNERLVEKTVRALKPGGRLVIHDYVRDPDGRDSKFVAMLAVHLLVFTGRGNVYTLQDYVRWMRRSGLREIRHKRVALDTIYPSTAVVGRKP